MKKFRTVCIGYDLCQHSPAIGYLAKPQHATLEEAWAYAKKMAAEDLQVLISSYDKIINATLSCELDIHNVSVTYIDANGAEHVYSEYSVHTIEECGENSYAYRDCLIEFDVNQKQYCISDDEGRHCAHVKTMRECCTMIDAVYADTLRLAT